MKYDFCIIITSYNRLRMLKALLSDINKYKFNILVTVFDDGSVPEYNLQEFDIKYIKYYTNNGKKGYWKLFNDTFEYCKHVEAKYFIYLPDDITLVDDFLNRATKIFNGIKGKNKLLNILLDNQRIKKHNWTGFDTIEYDNYYLTQWCDLCFIAKKNFFEALDYKINPILEGRWAVNPNKSSGVGEQISLRLKKLEFNMYHVKETMVKHGDHASVMNFEERQINKLSC